MLLLGSTGAVILPSNPNPGIASVASVTLEKLVVPLKVLNISDKELRLLKEVVLFNPGTLDLLVFYNALKPLACGPNLIMNTTIKLFG